MILEGECQMNLGFAKWEECVKTETDLEFVEQVYSQFVEQVCSQLVTANSK